MNLCTTESFPRFERHLPPDRVRERYQGCFLGGAVGDALGAPVEFMTHQEILDAFGSDGIGEFAPAFGKVGAITDDTQMALFTAEGVLRAHVRATMRGMCHAPSVIHRAYLRWLHTQGEREEKDDHSPDGGWLIGHQELFARRAPGVTCLEALRTYTNIGRRATNDRKGCGGVMRVAPIGMLHRALSCRSFHDGPTHHKKAFDLACDAAALTHGHPTGFLTAGVLAALVFDLLDGMDLMTAITRALALLKDHDQHKETLAAVERALALSLADMPAMEAIGRMGEGWVADEALAIGLYCALKATDFEAGVVMAVNHDGDSDSTGLIAGHLLGAMFGVSGIPGRWLESLELRDVIAEMADDLATAQAWRLDDWNTPEARAEAAYYTQKYPGG